MKAYLMKTVPSDMYFIIIYEYGEMCFAIAHSSA